LTPRTNWMDVDPFETRTTDLDDAARVVADVARRDARRNCAEDAMRDAVVDGVAAAAACMVGARALKCRCEVRDVTGVSLRFCQWVKTG